MPFETGVELADQLKQMVPKTAPLSQFALRWILDQPAVSTVIAGVTRPDQLRSNVDAIGLDPVEPAMMEELKGWYEDKVKPAIRGKI